MDQPVDDTIKNLFSQSERLFSNAQALRSLQQELAEHFYPERADFTTTYYLGKDFASGLTTSYPLSVRRDLASIFSTMLRPQEKVWAIMSTRNYSDLDEAGKRWLEFGTGLMRNAFYDQDSMFEDATSQSDDDIAVFGQAVISCEMNWRKQALLFRNWHLRDCVWNETPEGDVGRVDRMWSPCAVDLNIIFKGNVHPKVKECLGKEPYKTIPVRHMFVPVEQYDTGKGFYKDKRNKYVSIFYDIENKFVMEETPYRHKYYIVPRWKRVSGTQYAYSPATSSSLPDARLLQDMMLVLLEAGQKAVDPPTIAFEDFLRSDVNLFPGGITVAESDGYDHRMGLPLQPVFDSRHSNIPLGLEMLSAVKEAIRDAHYLNKVSLPPMGSGMSEMEIAQRVSEYVRGALPLFSPLEPQYNGQLCELAFSVLFANGGFGPPQSIPESLLGRNIEFKFENPLKEASDRAKASTLIQTTGILTQMAAFDPTVPRILDAHAAARDTIDGMQAPRKWFKPVEQVEAEVAAEKQAAALSATIQTIGAGGEAAKAVGEAGAALQGMQA